MSRRDKIKKDLQRAKKDASMLRSRLEETERRISRLETALGVLDEYDERGYGVDLSDDPSLIEAAERVLRAAGGTMAVSEIAEALRAAGFDYDGSRRSLQKSLSAVLGRAANSEKSEIRRPRRGEYLVVEPADGPGGRIRLEGDIPGPPSFA